MALTDPKVIHILTKANQLAAEAEKHGVTLRIERRPLKPLAMGHGTHAVEAWPARKQPTRDDG
jgi:hypothetical protein